MDFGADLVERDFFKDPFTKKELISLIGGTPIRDVFSFKSPSFRRLGLEADRLSDSRLLDLMMDDPRLIRRPLVVAGGRLIVGNDQAAFSEIFK